MNLMFNRILLATDGSNNSLRAADQAIKLASTSNGAIIEIVYVVDFETAKRDTLKYMDSVTIEQERKKRIQLTEGKIEAAGVKSKSTILHGDPGQTVVSYANDHSFDVVVIGSRGLNSLQEMVLGSVSHKVAKSAQCPVMIVK